MSFDNDWEGLRGSMRKKAGIAGMGVLRIALLFGSAAIALALIATPFVEDQSRQISARNGNPGIDTIATGSISYKGQYTVRRSILQAAPDSVCVIRDNGNRSGDC